MTTKVVIYTPAEDFWFNNPAGGDFVVWFIAVFAALLITNAMSENSRRPWRHWQVAGASAAITYILHYSAIWLLTYL